jgi:hypothetical protein
VQFGSPNIPKLAQCVAVVAVLQFQNRLYDSQKLTLYLYINIEVFLGYGNSLKRTATLQQLQQREQSDACINYAERQ